VIGGRKADFGRRYEIDRHPKEEDKRKIGSLRRKVGNRQAA
jgi:predicted methyltransferase MtxX (methanogen marker protein 4)